MKVAQSCPTLCDPMDYTVHGILQARILEWIAFPFSKGIFPTQGSNPGLPRCRWILYQLSHRFKEKSCCPLGEDPALLQRLVSFIFSLDCQELIWKANNAMLSEGCYIGNRCSNSAWVHVPLRWIIPWLTSLPEALPPN